MKGNRAMKRIVVTGAKGGTGRSIVNVLRAAEYDVLGVDVQPAEASDMGYVQLDLRNAAGVNDVLAGADGIVHFGSYPTDAWYSTTEAFHNIAVGGFNILQGAANTGIKRIVLASSIMTYGDLTKQPRLPITEESQLVPESIYGSSKRLLELLAEDYCRWHSMSIAAFRLGRIVYEGCFDWRLKKHTESADSAVSVLWSYVDARDVATACRAWLESERTGFEPFNLAAANVCIEIPTQELLRQFYAHVGDLSAKFPGHETPFDSGKFRRLLGWNARHDWRSLRTEYEQRNAAGPHSKN